MSGMHNYLDEIGDFSRETWDTIKNGSRAAVLAGHSQATARMVHDESLRLSAEGRMTYEEAEIAIVQYLWNGLDSRVNLNASLDKYKQPMRPGPDLARNQSHVGSIMKARQVTKSSKGKHPSNLTPPKKKRK